jgi:gamma-glutamylcyclotransferase
VELYFAYGSNMSSRRLQARVPGANPMGRVHVSDWQLAFNKPGSDGTGKANLVHAPGAMAWGVLYEIETRDWSVLDQYEPLYEKSIFRFETAGGADLRAQAYLYTSPPEARAAAPAESYLDYLLEGAREHGLPENYVARIRAFASPTSSER